MAAPISAATTAAGMVLLAYGWLSLRYALRMT